MVTLFRVLLAFVLALCAAEVHAAEESLELHLPGLSHHFGSPQQAGRSWTDFHDGLGVQWTRRDTKMVVRYTAGFMRDSFGAQGLYAGGSIGYRLLEGDHEIDLAAAPLVLYRTTRFDDESGKAPYKVIPVIMPLLSYEHRASGFGGNLTILPAGNFGKDLRFPGLIFVQFTYRLR